MFARLCGWLVLLGRPAASKDIEARHAAPPVSDFHCAPMMHAARLVNPP